MNQLKALSLVAIAAVTAMTASQSAVSARGGSYHVVKEVRQPGLWYGDSFVNDEDKRAIYSNYQGNGPQGFAGGRQGYGQNVQTMYSLPPNHAAPVPNYGSQGTQSSAPAYIGPSSYKYFVQEYDWKR